MVMRGGTSKGPFFDTLSSKNEAHWMTGLDVEEDLAKGASETEDHKEPGNVGLQDQLGHRDRDPMLKDADSDFPEPGRMDRASPVQPDCADCRRAASRKSDEVACLSQTVHEFARFVGQIEQMVDQCSFLVEIIRHRQS